MLWAGQSTLRSQPALVADELCSRRSADAHVPLRHARQNAAVLLQVALTVASLAIHTVHPQDETLRETDHATNHQSKTIMTLTTSMDCSNIVTLTPTKLSLAE